MRSRAFVVVSLKHVGFIATIQLLPLERAGAMGLLGWAGLFSELIRVLPAPGCTSHGPPGCTVAQWDSSVRTDSPTGDSGPLQEQRFFWCMPGLSRIPPQEKPLNTGALRE